MDYSNFYKFGAEGKLNALIVKSQNVEDSLPVIYGEVEENKLFHFTYHMGGTINDLVETAWPRLYLFHRRVFTALEAAGITGWKSYPTEAFDKPGKLLADYSVFAVTGRSGPIDYHKSERITGEGPRGQPLPFLVGLYFDLASWDGSDIFIADDSLNMIATQRVIDTFKEIRVTGFKWQPVAEVKIDAQMARHKLSGRY